MDLPALPFHGEGRPKGVTERVQGAKKPRRAIALRGKMLILSGLGVVEVLDLNCDCSIAALFIGSDNDSSLCPLGVELHVAVGSIDFAKLLSDQIDKASYETCSLIVCRRVSLQSAFCGYVSFFGKTLRNRCRLSALIISDR